MAAAKHFLAKAHRGLKDWEQSPVINTDKAPTYAAALADLKAEGKCPTDTQHRQVKYLNNIVKSYLRQAQTGDPPGTRFQNGEDGLCDDQRL
jgi:transposase-like protein